MTAPRTRQPRMAISIEVRQLCVLQFLGASRVSSHVFFSSLTTRLQAAPSDPQRADRTQCTLGTLILLLAPRVELERQPSHNSNYVSTVHGQASVGTQRSSHRSVIIGIRRVQFPVEINASH